MKILLDILFWLTKAIIEILLRPGFTSKKGFSGKNEKVRNPLLIFECHCTYEC